MKCSIWADHRFTRARELLNKELCEKRNDCMNKSEKIEIIGYVLAIITIFTLIQLPLLNAIGVVMAVRMLFRLKTIYSERPKTRADHGQKEEHEEHPSN